MAHSGPIGVFDSGIGGLSVARHICARLPNEHLIYFADSANNPYGDKPESFIIGRSFRITEFLLSKGVKALVVACNTATASAIHLLRDHFKDLPIVGVEPGLKPASFKTVTSIVGVMATARTSSAYLIPLPVIDIFKKAKTEYLYQRKGNYIRRKILSL